MRKINGRLKKDTHRQMKKHFVSCFLWWGVGGAIGLLFAISLDSAMQKQLAEHLRVGVSYVTAEDPSAFLYCLRRCLAYAQLLLLVWGLSYFRFGYMGVRLVLLARGFLYGFGQIAWITAYGFLGVWLGVAAYVPHNLLLIGIITWLEWALQETGKWGNRKAKQVRVAAFLCVPLLAIVEAYVSPAVLQYFL